MGDRNTPHMLAIVFDEPDPDYGDIPVRDIIRVEGTDANAKRRLRRRIVGLHGHWVGKVIYETHAGNGADSVSEDVTRRFVLPPAKPLEGA